MLHDRSTGEPSVAEQLTDNGWRTVDHLGRADGVIHCLVRHACGHDVRWSFFGSKAQARERMSLAELADCARCESGRWFYEDSCRGDYGPTCPHGTFVVGQADIIPDGGCDLSWPATGICHAHDGPCPDSPHDRFRHDRLTGG